MDLFKIWFWLEEFLLSIFLSQCALEHPWLLHSVSVSLLLSLLSPSQTLDVYKESFFPFLTLMRVSGQSPCKSSKCRSIVKF